METTSLNTVVCLKIGLSYSTEQSKSNASDFTGTDRPENAI